MLAEVGNVYDVRCVDEWLVVELQEVVEDLVNVMVLIWLTLCVTVEVATVYVVRTVDPEFVSEAIAYEDAVADAVADLVAVPPSPEILNGNEYWKMAGFLSREILKPNVTASVRVVGTAHSNVPLELSIPAV